MTNPNQIPPRIPPVNGPTPPVGELMGPDRWNRGAWLFRDRTLQQLEILLDEAFRVPGTGIRFGIDGIIGLVPLRRPDTRFNEQDDRLPIPPA